MGKDVNGKRQFCERTLRFMINHENGLKLVQRHTVSLSHMAGTDRVRTLCDVLFGYLFPFAVNNMAAKSLISVDFEVFGKVQGTALISLFHL